MFHLVKAVWAVSVLVSAPCCAHLARGQSSETDVGEVYGYVGPITGFGTAAYGGAGFGVARSDRLAISEEIGYLPLTREAPAPRTLAWSRLYTFSGSMHIRFAISDACAPYMIGNAGAVCVTRHFGIDRNPRSHAPRRLAGYFAAETGGGLRYYLANRWGLRPEVRLYAGRRVLGTIIVGLAVPVMNKPASGRRGCGSKPEILL